MRRVKTEHASSLFDQHTGEFYDRGHDIHSAGRYDDIRHDVAQRDFLDGSSALIPRGELGEFRVEMSHFRRHRGGWLMLNHVAERCQVTAMNDRGRIIGVVSLKKWRDNLASASVFGVPRCRAQKSASR